MNKLLLLSALLIFACSSDDSLDTNDSNVPNGQYFYEIKLADELCRIQGKNIEMSENGLNYARATIDDGDFVISFNLDDITTADYIIGSPMEVVIRVLNANKGSNKGYLAITKPSFIFSNYAKENDIDLDAGFVEQQGIYINEAISQKLINKIDNIRLADLGYSPSYEFSYDGGNVKGYYDGIIYFMKNNWNVNNAYFDTPVPIQIRFSVPRTN